METNGPDRLIPRMAHQGHGVPEAPNSTVLDIVLMRGHATLERMRRVTEELRRMEARLFGEPETALTAVKQGTNGMPAGAQQLDGLLNDWETEVEKIEAAAKHLSGFA